jgi:hypothetical protein
VKDTYKDFDEQFQVATLAGHTCWSSSFRPSRDNPVHFYLLANDDYCKLCVTLEYLRKRFREGIFAMICRRSGLDGYLRLFSGFPIFLGYSRNFENSAKSRRAWRLEGVIQSFRAGAAGLELMYLTTAAVRELTCNLL